MGNAGCTSSTVIKDQNKDPKLKPFEARGLTSQGSTLSLLFFLSFALWSFGLVCAALLLIARLTLTGSIGFSVTVRGALRSCLAACSEHRGVLLLIYNPPKGSLNPI